jgi:hypothetical protein
MNREEVEKALSRFFWGKKGMGERFSMKKLVLSIEEKALMEGQLKEKLSWNELEKFLGTNNTS